MDYRSVLEWRSWWGPAVRRFNCLRAKCHRDELSHRFGILWVDIHARELISEREDGQLIEPKYWLILII
jgi:hypothetical protein